MLSINFLRIDLEKIWGGCANDLDSEPRWIELDSHRHQELESLHVNLRADIGDLAYRDAAELNRSAGRQPPH